MTTTVKKTVKKDTNIITLRQVLTDVALDAPLTIVCDEVGKPKQTKSGGFMLSLHNLPTATVSGFEFRTSGLIFVRQQSSAQAKPEKVYTTDFSALMPR